MIGAINEPDRRRNIVPLTKAGERNCTGWRICSAAFTSEPAAIERTSHRLLIHHNKLGFS